MSQPSFFFFFFLGRKEKTKPFCLFGIAQLAHRAVVIGSKPTITILTQNYRTGGCNTHIITKKIEYAQELSEAGREKICHNRSPTIFSLLNSEFCPTNAICRRAVVTYHPSASAIVDWGTRTTHIFFFVWSINTFDCTSH